MAGIFGREAHPPPENLLGGHPVTVEHGRDSGCLQTAASIPMNEVTRILSAIEQGDSRAGADLLPLVYGELRRLAKQRLAREKPGQTLQATALVHEAYLRLVDEEV